jgi:acyl dehydratase
MITFADLQPGAALGECSFTVGEETVAQWTALFPGDRASLPLMPPAMIVMVVMRAYMALIKDRPPGNIHAGQKFSISRLPVLNETVTTKLSCMRKELKKDRRWVTFATDTTDAAGELLFRGEITTIWAA